MDIIGKKDLKTTQLIFYAKSQPLTDKIYKFKNYSVNILLKKDGWILKNIVGFKNYSVNILL